MNPFFIPCHIIMARYNVTLFSKCVLVCAPHSAPFLMDNMYSKTCVREPLSRLTLNSGWCGKSCLSYKGTCHVILLVILLAKLHGMYLYKTIIFPHQPLRSISKVAVLHRFYCVFFNVWGIVFDLKCFLYCMGYLDETLQIRRRP